MLSLASMKMQMACFSKSLAASRSASMILMLNYQRAAQFSQRSTLTPPKNEDLKFSSFLKSDKTYTVPAHRP